MKTTTLALLGLALFFSASLSGCKKDSVSSSSTRGNVTVKYEIVLSSPIAPDGGYPFVGYTNGTGQTEVASFTSGTTWSKEVKVTTDQRPLHLMFDPGVYILASSGTITGNIYINGEKKATATNPSTSSNGQHMILLTTMQYTVQ